MGKGNNVWFSLAMNNVQLSSSKPDYHDILFKISL